MISPTLLMTSGDESVSAFSPSKSRLECNICGEIFGKILNRPINCFKCKEYICSTHSSQERYDFNKKCLSSICDDCIEYEQKITFKIKLKNLKLKYYVFDGTYINKINHKSIEFTKYGLRNNAKIIKINNKNVESFDAQTIANTLNTIDIPYELTLDFIKCDDKNNHSPINMKLTRRHSVDKTIGFGAPISDKEMKQILKEMRDNKDDNIVTAEHSSTSSSFQPSLDGNYTQTPCKPPKASKPAKNGDILTLKQELKYLEEKINEFNGKYDKKALSEIFKSDECDNDYHHIEYELERIKVSNDQFQRRLSEIEQYRMTSGDGNNMKEYSLWDINKIISWIQELEHQRFDKYSNKLRIGFEKSGIQNGNDLVYVSQNFLGNDPFNIEDNKDCQDLAEYFHGLNQNNRDKETLDDNEHWLRRSIMTPVRMVMNVFSMFMEGS